MRIEELSESDLDALAVSDPVLLIAHVRSGRLRPAQLTYAAESLGSLASVAGLLAQLCKHDSAIVREGAVYGLALFADAGSLARSVLELMANGDPSPGVRLAAAEALSP